LEWHLDNFLDSSLIFAWANAVELACLRLASFNFKGKRLARYLIISTFTVAARYSVLLAWDCFERDSSSS
jgi:hypothetical protein